MYQRSRIKYITPCVIAIVIVILSFGLHILPTQYRKKQIVSGTWVLVEGGAVVPPVLVFLENGKGVSFKLEERDFEKWVDGTLTAAMVSRPEHFQWEILPGENNQGDMMVFSWDNYQTEVHIFFDEEHDEYGVRTIALTDQIGGGLWVEVKSNLLSYIESNN